MRKKSDIEIDYFLLGVSKSATSWIYYCFLEHPEIFVPSIDSLKYFDLKYHKGHNWYIRYFENADESQIIVDPSPTYFRSPVSPGRIATDFPKASFILSLRNPVDRAFSQFWHEKKKKRFDYEFCETVDSFFLYSWYIETGFYATHLNRFLRLFDRDRFKIVLFDDLTKDPKAFISQIYDFLEVDKTFEPTVLTKKINQAGVDENKKVKTVRSICRTLKRIAPLNLKRTARKSRQYIENLLSNKAEYDEGIEASLRQELLSIYTPEINTLENLTGLDLASWKK